jgi:hypothetical protein
MLSLEPFWANLYETRFVCGLALTFRASAERAATQ